jgi:hypothetical protein
MRAPEPPPGANPAPPNPTPAPSPIPPPGPPTSGLPCSYSVTPPNLSIAAEGGTGSPTAVSTSAGCEWTAVSNEPSWLSIRSGQRVSGPGTVTFDVNKNTDDRRTGTLTVAGWTVTITQDEDSKNKDDKDGKEDKDEKDDKDDKKKGGKKD